MDPAVLVVHPVVVSALWMAVRSSSIGGVAGTGTTTGGDVVVGSVWAAAGPGASITTRIASAPTVIPPRRWCATAVIGTVRRVRLTAGFPDGIEPGLGRR